MSDWGLIIEFTDGSESFTNGFELGQIFEKLKSNKGETFDFGFEDGTCVHRQNLEVIERTARHFGYIISKKETIDEDWTKIMLEPFRLKLVETGKQ
jgi:hypothetical protein